MRRRSTGHELAPVTPAERGAPLAARLMFAPLRLISRRAAPRLSGRLFATVWRVVDDEKPPPSAEQADAPLGKLALALALEGACHAVIRGLLDQTSRRQFARLTGRWPGRSARP